MEELKPCPFCGGASDKIVVRSRSQGAYWEVQCQADCPFEPETAICGATISADIREEAIAAWNRRRGE